MSTTISQWKDSLSRTRKIAFSKITTLIGTNQINDDLWEELETILIQADIGLNLSMEMIYKLQDYVGRNGITDPNQLFDQLKNELISTLPSPQQQDNKDIDTSVIMIVGVNGSGKTTTVAKLGHFFKTLRRLHRQ